MLKYSLIVLLSCLAGLTPVCYAQDTEQKPPVKYYDVEVIVFKNIKVPKSHEFKLPVPAASRTDNTLDLSDPSSISRAAESGFTPLTAQQLKLQDVVDRIVKSSRYQLLTHIGWRQPGLDEDSVIPVWIKGGTVFDSRFASIDHMITLKQDVPDQTEPQARKNAIQKTRSLAGLYELEGLVTITLSRYLHTKVELVLRKPAEKAHLLQQVEELPEPEQQDFFDMETELLQNYGLTEQRRMRSRRLHYLDHPEFGMLVLITPYEAPEQQDPEPEQTITPESSTTG